MMKKEWRKLNFSDPQISCNTVLKTDQNQCISSWPWRAPGVTLFGEKLKNCSVPVIAASLDKPTTRFYYDSTTGTCKVRRDNAGLITPLLSTSNLAPTVKNHFYQQCNHRWYLSLSHHSNNKNPKFISGVAGLFDLSSPQVLRQK